jgi:site-specific DNA-methyltransferase (adenine-specific)/adenine-specific DNA-methyltransferase
MTPEQREQIVHLLQKGEDLSPEWARILFPPEKHEYELVYHGKEREEEILANTLAVPLQPVRTFGSNLPKSLGQTGGHGSDQWQNMLVFGDNLQVMKSLLEMKKAGKLCNVDGPVCDWCISIRRLQRSRSSEEQRIRKLIKIKSLAHSLLSLFGSVL